MTAKFKWLLREEGHTQETWAKAMGMGRARLCQAIGNVAGRGVVRRPQIMAWMLANFQRHGAEMLRELGWVERSTGNVPVLAHGHYGETAGILTTENAENTETKTN